MKISCKYWFSGGRTSHTCWDRATTALKKLCSNATQRHLGGLLIIPWYSMICASWWEKQMRKPLPDVCFGGLATGAEMGTIWWSVHGDGVHGKSQHPVWNGPNAWKCSMGKSERLKGLLAKGDAVVINQFRTICERLLRELKQKNTNHIVIITAALVVVINIMHWCVFILREECHLKVELFIKNVHIIKGFQMFLSLQDVTLELSAF